MRDKMFKEGQAGWFILAGLIIIILIGTFFFFYGSEELKEESVEETRAEVVFINPEELFSGTVTIGEVKVCKEDDCSLALEEIKAGDSFYLRTELSDIDKYRYRRAKLFVDYELFKDGLYQRDFLQEFELESDSPILEHDSKPYSLESGKYKIKIVAADDFLATRSSSEISFEVKA